MDTTEPRRLELSEEDNKLLQSVYSETGVSIDKLLVEDQLRSRFIQDWNHRSRRNDDGLDVVRYMLNRRKGKLGWVRIGRSHSNRQRVEVSNTLPLFDFDPLDQVTKADQEALLLIYERFACARQVGSDRLLYDNALFAEFVEEFRTATRPYRSSAVRKCILRARKSDSLPTHKNPVTIQFSSIGISKSKSDINQQLLFEVETLECVVNTPPPFTHKFQTTDFFRKAIRLERRRKFKEASKAYSNELKRLSLTDISRATVAFNLGNCLFKQRQYAAAIERYKQATEINLRFVQAWNNLGTTLLKVPGCVEEAIEAFQTAIHIDSDFADSYYNLAQTYSAIGNRREAQRYNRFYSEKRNESRQQKKQDLATELVTLKIA